MNFIRSALPLLLAVGMLCQCSLPAFAASAPSKKEEVIYATLAPDGEPGSVYVVNSFDGGAITDYGDYTSVTMLNTTDPITQTGDTISFSTSAKRVYYEGTMRRAILPWNISLRYFLDGKEYDAADIAGKSGALTLRLSITKNPDAAGDFFENYALQASLTLDTARCRSIVAPDATIANVGGDKQLSFTILPGKGISTTISADVTDFTMSGVSISGIRLHLGVAVDDNVLMEKVGQLIDATVLLDNGAKSLHRGADTLGGGGNALADGAKELTGGIEALDKGVTELQSGLQTAQKGLISLSAQSSSLTKGSAQVKAALLSMQSALGEGSFSTDALEKLTSSSGEIKTSIESLSDGAGKLEKQLGWEPYKALLAQKGVNPDDLTSDNSRVVSLLGNQIAALESALSQAESTPGSEAQIADLKNQIALLKEASTLLQGNSAALIGAKSYLTGVEDSMSPLTKGLASLKKNYADFHSAIATFAGQMEGTASDVKTLIKGLDALVASYQTLDEGIRAYTGGVDALASKFPEAAKGADALADGTKELRDGSRSLYDGARSLVDGIDELLNGAGKLAGGTGELRSETSDMDSKIQEEIDALLSSIGGSTDGTVSFTSPKNTRVESVQFVMQTGAVTLPTPEPPPQPEESHPGFVQKFLSLFGLD